MSSISELIDFLQKAGYPTKAGATKKQLRVWPRGVAGALQDWEREQAKIKALSPSQYYAYLHGKYGQTLAARGERVYRRWGGPRDQEGHPLNRELHEKAVRQAVLLAHAAEKKVQKQHEAPGPAPRPHLRWDPISRKWILPETVYKTRQDPAGFTTKAAKGTPSSPLQKKDVLGQRYANSNDSHRAMLSAGFYPTGDATRKTATYAHRTRGDIVVRRQADGSVVVDSQLLRTPSRYFQATNVAKGTPKFPRSTPAEDLGRHLADEVGYDVHNLKATDFGDTDYKAFAEMLKVPAGTIKQILPDALNHARRMAQMSGVKK